MLFRTVKKIQIQIQITQPQLTLRTRKVTISTTYLKIRLRVKTLEKDQRFNRYNNYLNLDAIKGETKFQKSRQSFYFSLVLFLDVFIS